MAPTYQVSAKQFLQSQLCTTLPVPTKSFEGQTVIITGSNTGLGFEAAKHIVRLKADKVILAVRSVSKGETAAKAIRSGAGLEKSPTKVEVWQLDLSSYDSTQDFASRVDKELERLDVVIENAGLLTENFKLVGEDETQIKVNVLGTMFLALLLLPKLRDTASKWEKDVVLTFVGSFMHWSAKFEERKADDIFKELADETKATMYDSERYSTSKLMELLTFRELASNLTQPQKGYIVTSLLNPGGVKTDVMRDENMRFAQWLQVKIGRAFILRSTEEGSRTLVHAAQGDRDTDRQYLDDCKPAPPHFLSPFVRSDEGKATQKKVWQQMLARFENIKPGITMNL
ncbi:unnamed protein product [Clonostachys rosea]|uniref:Ketoreductase (KR) domain-containing protein n=1 Tax=Bionectria ochroleuca TaxID=29856 RepID=A0ABY6U402_BIOOC|nr:unnamed protein product [Clonostachys rosea]